MVKKYINAFKSKPILTALISSFIIGVIGTGIWMLDFKLISNNIKLHEVFGLIVAILVIGSLASIFLVYPVLLSIINLIYLFNLKKDELSKKQEIKVEVTTIIVGSIFMFLASGFVGIKYKDWNERIFPYEIHTPIATEMMLTICIFILVSILGYLILRFAKINKLSP